MIGVLDQRSFAVAQQSQRHDLAEIGHSLGLALNVEHEEMRNGMRLFAALIGVLVLVAVPTASAEHHRVMSGAMGLANATVLIIRHAENAESGPGLSPAGDARARAYVRYFRPFMLGREQLRIDTLIAAADGRRSYRSRLTLEPLSHASRIPIQQPFADHDVRSLTTWLGQGRAGRTILIAWHHGELPKLINEFGLDPSTVLPAGDWPSHVYNWVVVLRFDPNGAVIRQSCRLIREPTLLG